MVLIIFLKKYFLFVQPSCLVNFDKTSDLRLASKTNHKFFAFGVFVDAALLLLVLFRFKVRTFLNTSAVYSRLRSGYKIKSSFVKALKKNEAKLWS